MTRGGRREKSGRKQIEGREIKLKISNELLEMINERYDGNTQSDKIRNCLKVGISSYNDRILNIISLFSGAGGMDLGFISAGFSILWANDFNADAVETYKKNIGDHIVLGDISEIASEDIPGKPGEVDVVIGGFPCQGFSIANNNRSMEDSRNFLYLEMLRIIKDKKPKFFVAENVKGLLSMDRGQVINMIVKDFESIGYRVDYKLVNAADYGVPQARERVIIMGNCIGVENIFPEKTHADLYPGEENNGEVQLDLISKEEYEIYQPYVTVKDSIGFLSDVELVNGKVEECIEVNGLKIHNHIASTKVEDKFWGRKYDVNQADICDYLKYWRTKSGWSTKKVDEHFGYKHTAGHWFRKDNKSGSIPKPSDWWELKKILGFDDKYDKEVTTFVEKSIKFEQSLRITNWNRASDTITATSPEIHVNKRRRLSVRECAILQTFPYDHVFQGSLNSQYRQVGNAVPVLLAEKIGEKIAEQIRNSAKEKEVQLTR
ncbi:DNA cytosine methyltransferase [Gottfriedia solisilvae]|uniref:DNA cytosine methyltransferase n=1 Tax=Gottfriedia solisilvae TaxID=1516104 RepID=UPI003D2F3E03